MSKVVYKKWGIRIADVYGTSEHPLPKADLIIHSQLPEPRWNLPGVMFHKSFSTLHLNLSQDEETLFRSLSTNTRYKINRAAKRDNLHIHFESSPSEEEVRAFARYYNPFAKKKKIWACNLPKLLELRKRGMLVLSRVTDDRGQILAAHAYIADGRRAGMLYSVSHRDAGDSRYRNLIGRANRYLHWRDIQAFKAAGYQIYDFLGLHLRGEDQALNNIDQFKKGFGGLEVMEYKSYQACTWLGRLVLLLMFWMWRKSPELILPLRGFIRFLHRFV